MVVEWEGDDSSVEMVGEWKSWRSGVADYTKDSVTQW